jgi:hypothetical protein
MKYNSYAELFAAYKSGELTEPLMMDNDASSVYVDGEEVFSGNGECDTVEILKAIGIPCKYV